MKDELLKKNWKLEDVNEALDVAFSRKVEEQSDYNKAGLITGIVGLFIFPLIFGIVSLILGAVAKGKGEKKNGAIIIGIVDILVGLICIYLIFK